MIKKLRSRFIKIATLSVAAVMLLLAVAVNAASFYSSSSDLDKTINLIYENDGTVPENKVEPPKNDKGTPPPDKKEPPKERGNGPFTAETPYSTRFFVLKCDESGNLVSSNFDKIASVTENDTSEFLAAALKKGHGYGFYGNYKFFVSDPENGEKTIIFLDCYREIRTAKTLLIWSGVAVAGCTLLVFLLVVFFSKKAVEPVAESYEKQKRFITDASHELKTPITVIATSLRVLEMETGKQKWIDKAKGQTEKLTELVNSLVSLSRLDEEKSPLKFSEFNISDAVNETAGSFSDFAASNGKTLEISVEPDITYNGDEYAVRQLVSILIDNSIKYADPSSPILVSLKKSKKKIIIKTENACAEPIKGDLSKLFDRFYRADESRNSETGGFGIGLSLAKSIAEGHGGKISASSPEENRIEFTVTL